MSISWLFTNLLAAVLLPPLNGLLLILAGVFLWRRFSRLARGMVVVGTLLLWVLAMPVVGNALLRTLEGEPLAAADLKQAQAIVVLGGGRYRDAPEYGADTVGEPTLLRLRYAAKLQRESGLPILLSGGKPEGGQLSEAETMRHALMQDFGVPVRWIEDASDNTHENAAHSARMLKADGVQRILLVTHAWHMPRAASSFSGTGLTVIPAGIDFHRQAVTPLDFLPRDYGRSRHAFHEWIGLVWYRIRQ